MMGLGKITAVSGLCLSLIFGGTAAAEAGQAGACGTGTIEIYFSVGSSELSDQSKAVLDFAMEELESCRIRSIDYQLADASTSTAGQSLTALRVQQIQAALQVDGIEPDISLVAQSATDDPAGEFQSPLRARRITLAIDGETIIQS